MYMKGKRGIALESLIWWIIAIAVLGIMRVLAVVLKDKLHTTKWMKQNQ